jgi:hypothetical protein
VTVEEVRAELKQVLPIRENEIKEETDDYSKEEFRDTVLELYSIIRSKPEFTKSLIECSGNWSLALELTQNRKFDKDLQEFDVLFNNDLLIDWKDLLAGFVYFDEAKLIIER